MDVAHGSELTYFDVGAFHADRRLPALPGGFVTVAGLDGVPSVAVPDATAVLVSRLRRFESLGTIRTESGVRPKGGFRWVEWEESFAMTAGTETFTTRTINSLYGYQWGLMHAGLKHRSATARRTAAGSSRKPACAAAARKSSRPRARAALSTTMSMSCVIRGSP
jgi:hypothetical protein